MLMIVSSPEYLTFYHSLHSGAVGRRQCRVSTVVHHGNVSPFTQEVTSCLIVTSTDLHKDTPLSEILEHLRLGLAKRRSCN